MTGDRLQHKNSIPKSSKNICKVNVGAEYTSCYTFFYNIEEQCWAIYTTLIWELHFLDKGSLFNMGAPYVHALFVYNKKRNIYNIRQQHMQHKRKVSCTLNMWPEAIVKLGTCRIVKGSFNLIGVWNWIFFGRLVVT